MRYANTCASHAASHATMPPSPVAGLVGVVSVVVLLLLLLLLLLPLPLLLLLSATLPAVRVLPVTVVPPVYDAFVPVLGSFTVRVPSTVRVAPLATVRVWVLVLLLSAVRVRV